MSRRLRCNRIGVSCLEQENGLTDATRRRITVASQCNGASEKWRGRLRSERAVLVAEAPSTHTNKEKCSK